jgi:hypothetical protein
MIAGLFVFRITKFCPIAEYAFKQKNPTMRRFHIVGIKQEKEGGKSQAKPCMLPSHTGYPWRFKSQPSGTAKIIVIIAKLAMNKSEHL